jgi:hypothetical protein
MIKLCLLVSCILTLGIAAHAESYYDILKTQFNSSRTAPNVDEFDRVGAPQAKICLHVRAASPNEDQLVHLYRFTEVKDGRGPLLPEKRFEKVIFTEYANPDIRSAVDSVTTTFTAREVVSTEANNPNYSVTLKVRKSDSYLLFERTEVSTTDDKTTTTTSYGYCYSRQ